MRVNRAKQIRKHLKFYKIVCGVNLPYNVILDSNFIYAALKNKLDIRERLNKMLQIPGGDSASFFITKSALDELQSLGEKGAEALEFANSYCVVLLDTEFSTEELAHDKLLAFLENMQLNPSDHRSRSYFVASQDKDLRSVVNSRLAGVPLIYLNKVSVVLEPPSEASRKFKKRVENSKSTISAAEQTIVNEIKTHEAKLKHFLPVNLRELRRRLLLLIQWHVKRPTRHPRHLRKRNRTNFEEASEGEVEGEARSSFDTVDNIHPHPQLIVSLIVFLIFF